MRSRILLATLACLLAAAAPAAAQEPAPDPASLEATFEFDGAITPSFSEYSPALRAAGPATFAEDVDVLGVTRRVAAFGPEQPYRFDTGDLGQSEYALDLVFRLDAVDGRRRVMNVQGPGDPNALYVQDGRLVYERGATDSEGAAGSVAAGQWVHLVVVRRLSGLVRVYVDGRLDLSFADTTGATHLNSYGDPAFPGMGYRVRLFDGVGGEAVGGQLARLRLFEDDLSDEQAANLTPLDTTPATVAIDEDLVDGRHWLARGETLFSAIDDDSSGVALESWVEDTDGAEVAGTRVAVPRPVTGPRGLDVAQVRTYLRFGPYPALEDGRAYTLVVRTEDASGNASAAQRFPIGADYAPPSALTIDGPAAQTDDRSPLMSGTATVGPRDETDVYGELCRGTTCDSGARRGFAGDETIGDFAAQVVDGRWSAEVREVVWDDDEEEPVARDLEVGTYTARVWFCDEVRNCISRDRTFEVVAELPRDEQPETPKDEQPGGDRGPSTGGGQGGQSAPPVATPEVPAPPRAVLPPLPAPRTVVAQLSAAVARGVAGKGLRGLRAGQVLRLAPARPGAVAVRVLAGRTVVAQGTLTRGTLRLKATAKGRTKLRGKRRLPVVVRTTFVPAGAAAVSAERRLTLRG